MERGFREHFYHAGFSCFVSKRLSPEMGGFNFTWRITRGRYEAGSASMTHKEAASEAKSFAEVMDKVLNGVKP